MTPDMQNILRGLRQNVESDEGDGWGTVYLDNVRACFMLSAHGFAGYLSALEKAGVYRPIDGYAWGMVRLTDDTR